MKPLRLIPHKTKFSFVSLRRLFYALSLCALVASVGGGRNDVIPVFKKLSADKEPTALKKNWEIIRKEIFAKRLKATAGNFNLMLRVATDIEKGKAFKPSARQAKMRAICEVCTEAIAGCQMVASS